MTARRIKHARMVAKHEQRIADEKAIHAGVLLGAQRVREEQAAQAKRDADERKKKAAIPKSKPVPLTDEELTDMVDGFEPEQGHKARYASFNHGTQEIMS